MSCSTTTARIASAVRSIRAGSTIRQRPSRGLPGEVGQDSKSVHGVRKGRSGGSMDMRTEILVGERWEGEGARDGEGHMEKDRKTREIRNKLRRYLG